MDDVKMDLVEGVYLPHGEQHMRDWMTIGKRAERVKGKITYQWWKQKAAMEIAREHDPEFGNGVFVDVGGHCGFWSMWWGRIMSGIVAYEPIPILRAIYEKNVRGNGIDWDAVSLAPYALSDTPGKLAMKYNPANTGATRIYAEDEDHTFPVILADVVTLDATLPMYLGDRRMAVLKIDCEGFEERVILGGLNVIREHRPVIIVEQKFEDRHFGFKKKGAVDLLERGGYRVAKEISGDHIMVYGG